MGNDTGDNDVLRFGTIADLIISRHEDDWQDFEEAPPGTYAKDYCRETAALVFVEAMKVVDQYKHYVAVLEKCNAGERERLRNMKEQRDEAIDKAVELDKRLRDPNRKRPDPLGPSVPRSTGQPALVELLPHRLVAGETCLMGGLVVMFNGDPEDLAECPKCGRVVKVTKMGKYYQHKVPA